MDPKILFKGESKIFNEVDKYLTIFKKSPYIFNLGHGLLPGTNPDILKKIIERVSNFKWKKLLFYLTLEDQTTLMP